MKKIISVFMAIIFSFSFCASATAAPLLVTKNLSPESQNVKETYYSKDEAAAIALFFIKKNIICSNDECVWTDATAITSSYTMYDFNENIEGYVFCLETGGMQSGYVFVAANSDCMPIREYAFSAKPIFQEKLSQEVMNEISKSESKKSITNADTKIVYDGGFDYYVRKKNEYYDLNGKKIQKLPSKIENHTIDSHIVTENDKIKECINEWRVQSNNYSGQLDGYAISDLGAYLVDRYGSYTLQSANILSSFTGLNMNDYGGDNDCIPVTITAIANWYRSQYPNIPRTPAEIYNYVLVKAVTHGYNTTDGVSHTVADDILEEVFSSWGYDISASNSYILSFNTVKTQINSPNSNPIMFHVATGYYANHTIAIIGYYDYNVADFLCVKDNWSTSTRYIHWQEMLLDFGCFTIIDA